MYAFVNKQVCVRGSMKKEVCVHMCISLGWEVHSGEVIRCFQSKPAPVRICVGREGQLSASGKHG